MSLESKHLDIVEVDKLKTFNQNVIPQLENNEVIKKLSIKKSFPIEAYQRLAEALKNNTTLTELDLQETSMYPHAAVEIANILRNSKSLISLNLSTNYLMDLGVISISSALENNSSLEFLNLSCNTITAEGVFAIAEALKKNTCLTSLNLRSNLLAKEGAKELFNALSFNQHLTHLNLMNNTIEIDEEIAEIIGEILRNNCSLVFLDLTYNKITLKSIELIAEALEDNFTLRELKLPKASSPEEDFAIQRIKQSLDNKANNCRLRSIKPVVSPSDNENKSGSEIHKDSFFYNPDANTDLVVSKIDNLKQNVGITVPINI